VEYANENEINPKVYDADYKATPSNPLVYHLVGEIDHPSSMVLTEQDYIDFVIFLNKNDVRKILPSAVRLALASNSILAIGYVLEDVNFCTIFRSIVNSLHTKLQISNIAVLQPSQINVNNKIIQAERYTKIMLKMQPFWADSVTFSEELRHRLDSFSVK